MVFVFRLSFLIKEGNSDAVKKSSHRKEEEGTAAACTSYLKRNPWYTQKSDEGKRGKFSDSLDCRSVSYLRPSSHSPIIFFLSLFFRRRLLRSPYPEAPVLIRPRFLSWRLRRKRERAGEGKTISSSVSAGNIARPPVPAFCLVLSLLTPFLLLFLGCSRILQRVTHRKRGARRLGPSPSFSHKLRRKEGGSALSFLHGEGGSEGGSHI